MIAVDLFAGAGGWTTGAELAGVRVAAAVDHWPRAVETHAANHPGTVHRCQDVALMDPRDLPAHDLLLGSPSCQGHTKARGTDRPHHDASRATAWAVVDVVETCRPRLLAVENVPEFLSWTLYPRWRGALEDLGYHLTEQVLDAADFGVPQTRRRLFVTGRLGRAMAQVPVPHLPAPAAEATIDWGAGTWSPVAGPRRSPATLRRAARCRERWGDRALVRYNGSARDGRPVSAPWGTITTIDRFAILDGDRMRMPLVDEYRRAMGFPEGYRLTGTRRDQVMQLGNAVCPPVARAVVEHLVGAA